MLQFCRFVERQSRYGRWAYLHHCSYYERGTLSRVLLSSGFKETESCKCYKKSNCVGDQTWAHWWDAPTSKKGHLTLVWSLTFLGCTLYVRYCQKQQNVLVAWLYRPKWNRNAIVKPDSYLILWTKILTARLHRILVAKFFFNVRSFDFLPFEKMVVTPCIFWPHISARHVSFDH